jgi:hypothetical protein
MDVVNQTEIGGEVPTNSAKDDIELQFPYIVRVQITGTADFLFHRWHPEAVKEKEKAAKGSKAKRSDNIESYVYRLDNGHLAIPGVYLRGSIITAARSLQDPRSPRKSAMDLYKAGITSLTTLADLGKPTWDYLDERRVIVQRNAVNRTRPAIKEPWVVAFELMVNIPEYIRPAELNAVIQMAGRLVGIGDYRPTYGRYQVTQFAVVNPVDAAVDKVKKPPVAVIPLKPGRPRKS